MAIPDAHTADLALEKVSYSRDKYISDANLIPDEVQERLIFWRDKFTEGSWDIGRICGDLIVRAAELRLEVEGVPITNAQLDKAAGRFLGKTGRTVRYYRETVAFFPPDIELDYPSVPFTHFAVARRAGDRWRDVIEHSALTSCTEETLEAMFLTFHDGTADAVEDGVGEDVEQDKSREISPNKQGDTQTELDCLSETVGLLRRLVEQVEKDHTLTRAELLSKLGDIDDLIERYDGIYDVEELRDAIDFLVEVVPTAMNAIQATWDICQQLRDREDVLRTGLTPLILREAENVPITTP